MGRIVKLFLLGGETSSSPCGPGGKARKVKKRDCHQVTMINRHDHHDHDHDHHDHIRDHNHRYTVPGKVEGLGSLWES